MIMTAGANSCVVCRHVNRHRTFVSLTETLISASVHVCSVRCCVHPQSVPYLDQLAVLQVGYAGGQENTQPVCYYYNAPDNQYEKQGHAEVVQVRRRPCYPRPIMQPAGLQLVHSADLPCPQGVHSDRSDACMHAINANACEIVPAGR